MCRRPRRGSGGHYPAGGGHYPAGGDARRGHNLGTYRWPVLPVDNGSRSWGRGYVVRGAGAGPIGVRGNELGGAGGHNYDTRSLDDFVRQQACLCGPSYSPARPR